MKSMAQMVAAEVMVVASWEIGRPGQSANQYWHTRTRSHLAFSECAPQSAIACKRYEEVASPQKRLEPLAPARECAKGP